MAEQLALALPADSAPDPLAPPDAPERSLVAEHLDRTLFVEAGAGSGKTSVLVSRVGRLVCRLGVGIDRIAAITFTEAAAAELRQRIREHLELVAESDPDPVAIGRAETALARLDSAALTTLHGFARRVLAEHGMAVGLPPEIEVLDEVASQLAFTERWSEWWQQLPVGSEDALAFELALHAGESEKNLSLVARTLSDNWDRLRSVEPEPLALPSVQPLLVALDEAVAFADHCSADGDLLLGRLRRLQEWRVELAIASPVDAACLVLDGSGVDKRRVGAKQNWNGRKDDAVEAVRRAGEVEEGIRAAIGDAIARTILAALVRFTLGAAADRRRTGLLEFHDLLVLARELVTDHPRVRAELHDRYERLLLDEFQDTDPIQLELAERIAADPDGRVPAGRLFLVGDPKQSIYRFRRADMGMYLRARERIGPPIQLTANFRSSAGVVDWANAVFSKLIHEEPDAQPPYVPLERVRSDPPIGPAVAFVGGPAEPDTRAGALRELEAADVAAAIRTAVDEGWSVHDGASGWRPAGWGDVAVLLPARTSLPMLEAALGAADVPYRLETGSLVYASQEVRDLVAMLRAVDDPTDEVAVVAALRSPALACTDADLLAHRTADGRWDPLAPGGEPDEHGNAGSPVVRAALAWLGEQYRRRQLVTLPALVDGVIRDRRLLHFAAASPARRDLWRRLRYVLDQAHAFTEAGGGSLRAFLAWTELRSSDAYGTDPVLPESDDQAVRVLTVHGAKGLEFPITVLSGLTTLRRNPHRGARLLWGAGGEPELKLRSTVTAGFDALVPIDEQLDRHERVRLLYVAVTRARDHLIVSAHHLPVAADREESYGELVWIHRGTAEGLADRRTDEREPIRVADDAPAEPGRSGPTWDPEAWQAERDRLIREGRRPAAIAATALAATDPLATDERDRRQNAVDEPDEEAAPWRRGRAGSAIGRAVHATLQVVPLDDLAPVDGLAAAQAVAEGVPERAAEVARLVRVALASPTVREAAHRRHWRELYVATEVDDVVIEGFVDLLVETPEGLVVVDYKTDAIRDEDDVERLLARYRLQGAAYALAVEAATGRPVVASRFVFLSRGQAREADVIDLPDAVARVRELVVGSVTASVAPA